MTTLTRQDVQSVVETAINRASQRTATRQDLQTISDGNRDRILAYLQAFLAQNQQQVFRQLDARNTQSAQRLAAMESHVAILTQELRVMRQQMERMAGQKPQRVIMSVPSDQYGGTQSFSYNAT